jgi:hypothetical protein
MILVFFYFFAVAAKKPTYELMKTQRISIMQFSWWFFFHTQVAPSPPNRLVRTRLSLIIRNAPFETDFNASAEKLVGTNNYTNT